jgi:rhodanese-related sulfurtransferase
MEHSPEFLKLVQSTKRNIKEIKAPQVFAKCNAKEDFVLVDVREESEWKEGHLPGAIHLGKGIIERDIEKVIPLKTKEIILYCGGGFRSALAAESIQKMGYLNVFSMDGGYRLWRENHLPVV